MGLLFSSALTVAKLLSEAYQRKETAKTNEAVIAAERDIAQLKAIRDQRIAEIRNFVWYSPQSIISYAVSILIIKLFVWDTVLGLGVTQDPGAIIKWVTITVVGSLFASATAKGIAAAIGHDIIGKSRGRK